MSMIVFYISFIIFYYLSLCTAPIYIIPCFKALPVLSLYFYRKCQSHPYSEIFLLSAIGDLFLGYDYLTMWLFVIGMCFFAGAHALLILYLRKVNKGINYRLFIFLCVMNLFLLLLYPILSTLTFAIVVYSMLLARLFSESMVNLNSKCHLGCLLFVISDIIILFELIFGYMGVALFLYWISIGLIAFNM